MRVKRILSALLAAALLASLAVVPAGAAVSSFSDVSDAAAAVNADILRLMGVVDGTGGNQFQPGENLTRAHFCTMVVKFMQKGDQVPLNATRTIFSDVTAKHWGLGYVNLAASLTVKDGEKDVPLVSGVGNGKFEPDEKISLAQAATILIRVLGYSSEQAGAVWPQSYMNLAASIGLTDGVSAGMYDNITRAQAAQLFVNALSCKTAAGEAYYKSLGTVSEDIIVLAVNVETDDGSSGGAVRTSKNKESEAYLPAEGEGNPYALQGKRGALVLNDKEEIVTFVPDDSKATTITLSGNAEPSYVKASGGSQYTMSKDTILYTSDATEGKSYLEGYSSLKSGTQITMYSERGKIVAVYASGSTASIDSDAVVVTGSVSAATFHRLTGGATNFNVQKNRQTIRLSDIQTNDVVTYDSLNNTLIVSDLRLTCVYEDAYPNAKAPQTITVLGHAFDVVDSAWDTTGDFSLGNQVTLLLTADGKVAGMAKPGAGTRSSAVGMVSEGSAEVFLPNGGSITLKGTVSNADNVADQLVTISSGTRGKISASKLSSQSAPGAFDVANMKLGSYTVSAGVQIYEQVSGGAMVAVGLSHLERGSIPAGGITAYHLNSSNMVDYIVLNDVTGDAYRYGMMVRQTSSTEDRIGLESPQEIKNQDGDTITIYYEVERDSSGNVLFEKDGSPKYKIRTTEKNSWTLVNGSSRVAFASGSGYSGKNGSFIGVAVGKNREGAPIIRASNDLIAIEKVAPSDFFESQGATYVTAGGKTYRVADDVECYRSVENDKLSEGNWFSQDTGAARLNACKAYSNNLTVYVDPVGEKVRIVAAN